MWHVARCEMLQRRPNWSLPFHADPCGNTKILHRLFTCKSQGSDDEIGSDKTCDPKDETKMSAMDHFFRYYLDATGYMLVMVHTTYSPNLTY